MSSIKKDNTQQLAELERLEKEISELKKREQTEKEKKQQAPVGWGLTNRMSLKFRLIGIFAVFLAYLAFKSLSSLFLILTAFIVSIAIEAFVEFFQKKLKHRGLAIVIAYLICVIIIL